tara:strand:+ start:68 stop:409 length:342 start_codon:yes stop_codon:yes gene_type:complete
MTSKKKKKKPYYHNNWAAIQGCPAEWFDDIEFDEFMDWKIAGWELPSSVNCMIRETNLSTGKVKEYVYSRAGDAKRRARAIMDEGVSEFIIATADQIHYMKPEEVPDYDDPLA